MDRDSRSFWNTSAYASIRALASPMPGDLDQIDQRLDRLTLAEVVAEGHRKAGDFVIFFKPVGEEPPRDVRRARIAILPPAIHSGAELLDEQQPARPASGRRPRASQFRLWRP